MYLGAIWCGRYHGSRKSTYASFLHQVHEPFFDWWWLLDSLKASKTFRELSLTRSIWDHKLRELDQEHAPDLPSSVPINSLSTRELRHMVIRAVRRYRNCISSSNIIVTRRATVDLTRGGIYNEFGRSIHYILRLLPGGKYMLRVSLDMYYLELWDVETNAFICNYTRPEEPSSHLGGQEVAIDFLASPNGDIYILAGHSLEQEGCV